MFESSTRFLLFDHHRVPYAVAEDGAGWGTLTWRGDDEGRTLRWPRSDRPAPPAAAAGLHRVSGIPFFGHVTPDAADDDREVLAEITDSGGATVAAVRRDARGNVTLPFDPAEATMLCWSEGYRRLGRSRRRADAVKALKAAYYRVRPLLPRRVQIALRRRFTGVQGRAEFPRWPVEPALHDLHDFVLALLAGVAGEPLPRIAAWPDGHTWALVLTHDVEHDVGLRHMHLMRDIELRHGVRSSWNLVARRYDVDDAVVEDLLGDGFEVGVHGLHHDGRDISRSVLGRRLPEMHRVRDRWHASGFRSPATNREWETMGRLGFDYDTSSPDTDPYEPDAGGCCSWLPFFNRDTVELPITLPQDHTLLEILERPQPTEWFDKAAYLAARGGMALLITHPDYMLSPERLDAYDRFLDAFAHDPDGWRPLPREAAAWWRRRAASRLERRDGEWVVRGAAADEARVELIGGGGDYTNAQPLVPPPGRVRLGRPE